MRKIFKVTLFVLSLSCICQQAWADIVFPAIAHQFMVSLVVPGYYSVALAISVVFTEAFFIKRFFQRGWVYGLTLSFLINLVSSIAGVFIVSFLEAMTRNVCRGIFGYSNMRLGTYLGMIPGYFITVVLEGGLLLIWAKLVYKNKFTAKGLVSLSSAMNLCSYLILALGILLANIATHGKNFKTY